MKRKVDVTLLGHRFTVKAEKDEAYVHALAAYVTRKVEELRRAQRSSSPAELALLAALTIADELFESADRASATRAEVRQRVEALMAHVNAAVAHADGVRALDGRAIDGRPVTGGPATGGELGVGLDAHETELVLAAAPARAR